MRNQESLRVAREMVGTEPRPFLRCEICGELGGLHMKHEAEEGYLHPPAKFVCQTCGGVYHE